MNRGYMTDSVLIPLQPEGQVGPAQAFARSDTLVAVLLHRLIFLHGEI